METNTMYRFEILYQETKKLIGHMHVQRKPLNMMTDKFIICLW
jgi:hypothetical protein